MYELQLSNDLPRIETEIDFYKNQAGQSIWEIGRRLNHVKENDLAHGEFMDWLKKIDIDQTTANKMMKVSKELPNYATSLNLGTEVMYLIAALPEDQKQHYLERAEEGDSPTVKELREQKKKNKELESQLEAARRSEQIAISQLEEAQNKPPQVIEKEAVPEDYEELKTFKDQAVRKMDLLTQENNRIKRQLGQTQEDLRTANTKYSLLESNTAEAKELERKIKSLQNQEKTLVEKMEAVDEFIGLEKAFDEFFDQNMAPLRFKDLAQYLHATNAVERMQKMVAKAEMWAEEMRKILPSEGRVIAEGVYIDE